MIWQKVLFIRNDVENGPENQIIPSCLAELRHDGSDVKRQFEKNSEPRQPGFFVIRRYDRGIREGALHQYPCHIVDLT